MRINKVNAYISPYSNCVYASHAHNASGFLHVFWFKAGTLHKSHMGRNRNKALFWARQAHNPGLVRLKIGKKNIGVFHALPCSLLKASKNVDKEMSIVSPILIREDDRKTPLSHTLTLAMQKRIPEKIEEQSMDVEMPAPN